MKTLFLIAALVIAAPPALAAGPEKNPHHVMWTAKGKQKCCNKATQEKADRCAEKMRAKGATNVQVMAGKCKEM